MEMCYDGALVMPSSYAIMNEEEMMYVEGGIAVPTAVGIAVSAVTLAGATYGAGVACGKRLYHAGVKNKKTWAKVKWPVRAAVLAYGKITGAIFMLGLENQLYDMM